MPPHNFLKGIQASLGQRSYDDGCRGVGGTVHVPCTSVGEENLLGELIGGDPHFTHESILVHEFSHAVMNVGLTDEARGRITAAFVNASESGEFDNESYMMSNAEEFWAEGAQAWFHASMRSDVNCGINTRDGVIERVPELAALVSGPASTDVSGSLLLAGIRDEAALRSIAGTVPGATWIDRPALISELLARLRRQATALILAAYGLIALILVRRYGWRGGAAVLWVPLGASGAAFGLLTLGGVALNLFHLLSLLLVLGIAVDYAIFLREAVAHRAATLLAVLLSALTTLFAFGLLSLSSTPALSAFGSVVAIGIPAALLLAAAQFRSAS